MMIFDQNDLRLSPQDGCPWYLNLQPLFLLLYETVGQPTRPLGPNIRLLLSKNITSDY